MSVEAASVIRAQGTVIVAEPAAQPNVLLTIWPLLLIAMIGNLPNPAINIFVGPLSSSYGVAPSTIGSMRGIGGGPALLVGFLIAPLLDRIPRAITVIIGLGFVVLAAALP